MEAVLIQVLGSEVGSRDRQGQQTAHSEAMEGPHGWAWGQPEGLCSSVDRAGGLCTQKNLEGVSLCPVAAAWPWGVRHRPGPVLASVHYKK